MAVQERKAESSLDRYIAEVRAAWGDGNAIVTKLDGTGGVINRSKSRL